MLDVLIGSLFVAFALVVVYWVLVLGRPLVREAKDSKGAVETPPLSDTPPEAVKVYHVEDLKLWCRSAKEPLIIKRQTVNANRVVESVEEYHLFADGVDMTVSNYSIGLLHQILTMKGTATVVKGFVETYFDKAARERINKVLGL